MAVGLPRAWAPTVPGTSLLTEIQLDAPRGGGRGGVEGAVSICLSWPRPGALEKGLTPACPFYLWPAPLPPLGLPAPLPWPIHSQSPSAALRKGETSKPQGWGCWPWASPASLLTTPSPNVPTLACPLFMAGKVLIPSAERWARVCGQERRDCLRPPAVLGSSGPAGWPRSDMFILWAQAGPRSWQGRLRVLSDGDRLVARGCLCPCFLLSPSLLFPHSRRQCGAEASRGHCPHHRASCAPLARRPAVGQGSRVPLGSPQGLAVCSVAFWGPFCPSQSRSHAADSCRAPSLCQLLVTA